MTYLLRLDLNFYSFRVSVERPFYDRRILRLNVGPIWKAFIEEKFNSIIPPSWWMGTAFKYAIPYISVSSWALQICCLQWSDKLFCGQLSWPCPVNGKKTQSWTVFLNSIFTKSCRLAREPFNWYKDNSITGEYRKIHAFFHSMRVMNIPQSLHFNLLQWAQIQIFRFQIWGDMEMWIKTYGQILFYSKLTCNSLVNSITDSRKMFGKYC